MYLVDFTDEHSRGKNFINCSYNSSEEYLFLDFEKTSCNHIKLYKLREYTDYKFSVNIFLYETSLKQSQILKCFELALFSGTLSSYHS